MGYLSDGQLGVSMRYLMRLSLLIFLLIGVVLPLPSSAHSEGVRALLFFSPTCPHCHTVITEDLPILWEMYGGYEPELYFIPPTEDEQDVGASLTVIYGEHLEILYVNVLTPVGSDLYRTMLEQYKVPNERQGVPALIVGETHLVGAVEIPELFPQLIEEGIEAGGVDWPDFPGLSEQFELMIAMPTSSSEGESLPEDSPAEAQAPTSEQVSAPAIELTNAELSVLERFNQDPLGNGFSVVVLIGMLFSALWTGSKVVLRAPSKPASFSPWAVPVLTLGGILVAGYLTYVESTNTLAVCGPVGDCNAVQQSAFAKLFGILPIGLLGLTGYIGILGAWFVSHRYEGRVSDMATVAIFAIATLGTLFSMYLTFLEPFVIGATCVWCLSSAVLITLIMLLTLGPATSAWGRLRESPE
jgi:uncharacterized membrane protein